MGVWQQGLNLVLILATAGLSLATGFALAARQWWLFDLFSHFRIQYVVAAAILGLLALGQGRYRIATLLGLIALIHTWTIKEVWLGSRSPAHASAAATPLRLASANVLASNPSPGEVAHFLRTVDADLAILVDAQGDRWAPVLEQLAGLYPFGAPADWQDGAPVMLLSRHPIVEQRVIRPAARGRPYLLAEVALGDGPPALVAAVHPQSPAPADATDSWWRNLELAYIAESLDGADGVVIVAGDFNTTPWSPHMADLMNEADLRHAAAGEGYLGSWPVWLWPARIPIDHVLVKGPVGVARIGLGPDIGSDHFPLVADLRLLQP